MLAWIATTNLVHSAGRSSSAQVSDTLLLEYQATRREPNNGGTGLEGGNPTMEKSLPGGASEPTHRGDSEPRRKLYGDGRGARRRRVDSPTVHITHGATRYIETEFGILTCQELAPLLAEQVSFTELDIARRNFAALPVEKLLLELHRQICGDLVPDISGRWRVREVQVGLHIPPPHWRVPVLMREFAS